MSLQIPNTTPGIAPAQPDQQPGQGLLPVVARGTGAVVTALPEHQGPSLTLQNLGWLTSRDEPQMFHEEVSARLARGEKPSDEMLDQAITHGRRDTVDLLLANGADPNAAIRNCTALNLSGTVEVLGLLRKYGADVFGVKRDGQTLFEIAHHAGDLDCKLKLSKLKWSKRTDANGDTELHRACRAGQPRKVQALLAYRASTHAENAKFETPVVSTFKLPKEKLFPVLREIVMGTLDGAQTVSARAAHYGRTDIMAWLFAERILHPSVVRLYEPLSAEFLKCLDEIFDEAESHDRLTNCVEVLANAIATAPSSIADEARKLLESWHKRPGEAVVEVYTHKRQSIGGRRKLRPFVEEIKVNAERKREIPTDIADFGISVGEITSTLHRR